MAKLLYYFSHIVNNRNLIYERDPISAEAGRLRSLYISRAINAPIKILSMGNPRRYGVFYHKKETLDENIHIEYLPVANITQLKFIKYLVFIIVIFIYCLLHIKKGSKVLIYNAIAVYLPLFILKRIKKYEVTLEIEELYSSYGHQNISQLIKNMTEKYMINNSDKYIVANNNIIDRIDNKKPVLLSFGYSTAKEFVVDKHHAKTVPMILYSGRLDYEGGIEVLLESIQYILRRCEIIVTGSGIYEKKVAKYQYKNDYVDLRYLGFVPREAYEKLLLKAQLCVNPTRAKENFSSVSFPSKILQYLEYGNVVVSSNFSGIESLEHELRQYIHVYNDDSPANLGYLINNLLDKEYDPEIIAFSARSFFEKQKILIREFLE